MTTRRAIARAGLVLALAVLSPASALADAGGYRPTKGTGSSMIRLNTKTLHFTADGTGFMTHLARYSVHFDGQARPIRSTPPNKVAVAAEGTMTLAAANGDELYGVFKLTTEDFVLGAGHKDTLEITITGGSGRFESADGTLEATSQIGPGTFVDEDEVTWMVSRSEDTITGQISY